ncbi:FAD:protein FMN transferase [Bergeyella porcorum]|uniref:FAD:protein FMN transferase n=1 Tax=Bergeyella porcorum TaxID=1735111 RepID=UPI0035EDAB7B
MRVFALLLLLLPCFAFSQKQWKQDTLLMGSPFTFVVYNDDEALSKKAIAEGIAEVVRIENEISDWLPHTPVSKINAMAGHQAVKVSQEVFELFKRAIRYSQISDGIFDITYAGMERIWKFDGSMNELPTQEQLNKALKTVGYQHIQLDETQKSVFLQLSKSKVSFGSIGKAYAAQRAAEKMKSKGVEHILVNAAGDLYVFGNPPGKDCWRIGLQNPFRRSKTLQSVCVKDEAILTSGDYEKFVFIDGKRYGHIINPKTGMPSTQNVSVTVKGKNAELANFLSTTLMLLDKKQAKALAKQYPEYKIWLVQSDGKTRRYN